MKRWLFIFPLLILLWCDVSLAQGLVEPRYNKSSSNTWVWNGSIIKTRLGKFKFRFDGRELRPVFGGRPVYVWRNNELRPRYNNSFSETIQWNGRSLERKTNRGREWIKRENTWKLKYGNEYFLVKGDVPVPIIIFVLFRLYRR